jgi:hypothetical protein
MRHFIVQYEIRKGLGPEWVSKTHESTFDDIDPETPEFDLKRMAVYELETRLRASEDYPLYGKNWNIAEVNEVVY